MIKLTEDVTTQEDFNAVADWLRTRPQLTQGPLVEEFEKKFAEKVGAKYALMVNSGSSANLLAMYCLSTTYYGTLSRNVICPAVSWSTTLSPIIHIGRNPIFVDCQFKGLGVDPNSLYDAIQKDKPSIAIIASILGFVDQLPAVETILDAAKIPFIHDSCETFMSKIHGRNSDSFGLIRTYSLYYSHILSNGCEGGVVTTDDKDLYYKMLMLREHGWTRRLPKDEQDRLNRLNSISEFDSQYRFHCAGFNFRNTEFGAFLALRALETIDEKLEKRKKNYRQYYDLLSPCLLYLPNPDKSDAVNFAVPIIHRERDNIVKALKNVCETRPLVSGSLVNHPVCNGLNPKSKDCPSAELVDQWGMYVPNHPSMTEDDIKKICDTIIEVISNV